MQGGAHRRSSFDGGDRASQLRKHSGEEGFGLRREQDGAGSGESEVAAPCIVELAARAELRTADSGWPMETVTCGEFSDWTSWRWREVSSPPPRATRRAMQHDKRMGDDPSYVQEVERQALACEEENDRLRAEIAAVRSCSLSTTLTGHRLILANARPADRSRAGSTAPTGRRGPSESRFEGQSDSRSLALSSCLRTHIVLPSNCQRLRDAEYTVAHLEATLSVMETSALHPACLPFFRPLLRALFFFLMVLAPRVGPDLDRLANRDKLVVEEAALSRLAETVTELETASAWTEARKLDAEALLERYVAPPK